MITRQYRPSWLRRLVLPGVTAVFLGYFGYHAVNGEYGMVGRERLETRTRELNAELSRLDAEKSNLESHVKLLRAESLDQDMVDERARIELSVVNPNEVVIMDFDRIAAQKN
ncbi:FtsB family cell division protein [Oryzibacter oryziterrae]|uniref:FtsB family cell division protein n=1 Tax=Oryzibacter oryziterrae TaxID=2766474 RepID=UPI001F2E010B|nr:septum formation initiator family protein [Oryzibacter oryziterrae]